MRLNRRSLARLALLGTLTTTQRTQAATGPNVVSAERDSHGQSTSLARVSALINDASATRSTAAYQETPGRLLERGYAVRNHGFPGDRTIEGLQRWQADPRVAIATPMYGTNDCLNYGRHPEPGTLPLPQLSRNLQALVRRRTRQGNRVIVVAPPPLADPAADHRLEPYRLAAGRVAKAAGAPFHTMRRHAGLWSDGVHLSPIGYTELAKALHPLVRHPPS